MADLNNLTDIELTLEILKLDMQIHQIINFQGSLSSYPEKVALLCNFYIKRQEFVDELCSRHQSKYKK
jgi:hypothetical protein